MVICDDCGKELGDYTKIRFCKDCSNLFLFGLKAPKE